MEMENRVVSKMNFLQQQFQSTKAFVEEGHDIPTIVEFIGQQTDVEFISIAYEAAAMGLALRDLEAGTNLVAWRLFLTDYGQEHQVQVYIGLGWACAQQRFNPSVWLEALEPLLVWRIWDGYGYYDGFFRKRKVLQGTLPENISEKALAVYWQGIGRSFWYTCKGNRDKLQKAVGTIPPNYLADFWRGIGIASTYVGGQTLEDGQNLWQLGEGYQAQLAAGAALAIKSRDASNTIVEETKVIAQEWCKRPISEIIDLLKNKAIDSTVAKTTLYHTWIAKLDQAFNA